MGGDALRSGRGALLLLFLVLIVIVVNVANWVVLHRVTAAVDDELGRRLVTVAMTAVTAATPELLLDPDVAHDDFVRDVLHSLTVRNGLESVSLLDQDGVVLFDLDDESLGERSALLNEDLDSFIRAGAGVPTSSATVAVAGEMQKAGYAPVTDFDGTTEAILAVSAGSEFHATLPALRRTLWGIHLGSGALILLLGGVFFGMSRRIQQTESALSHMETLSAMGMMAAGVAHEIRNPLTIISGTAERLRKKYRTSTPDASADALFDFIPEEVERLNGILEGYLRFARDEPLAFEAVEFVQVVRRCTRMVEEDFRERSIEIRFAPAADEIPGTADFRRLQQVLLNLLLNAAQAMPDGGAIEVTLEFLKERIQIGIMDSGDGFDPQSLATAFEPFSTTKATGSGLGLTMAQRIVEGHGGTIELANRPTGGACVTVTLPRDSSRSGG